MEIIRKSIKAYLAAFCFFVMLTLLLASAIQFTAFREEWALAGLLAALTLTSMVLGMLEGKICGKRGLLTGMAASVLFMAIILLTIGGVFADSFSLRDMDVWYLLPVLSGGVGGVLGANGAK